MGNGYSDMRPASGEGLNVVILGASDAKVVGGRVLLDRGRGLVIEMGESPAGGWERGTRVILLYSAAEAVWTMRGSVAEVLGGGRCYVIPSSPPCEMEKREYIRAEVHAPAALSAVSAAPGPLSPARVELSASGFRWFGPAGVAPQDRVRLRVELPEEGGRVADLLAEVVRVDAGEVAGRFLDPAPEDRDAVLRAVFRHRYAELGLQEDP